MKLRSALFTALCAAGLVAGGSAQAGILIENWTINLEAIGGAFTGYGTFGTTSVANGSVAGIDEMSFDSVYHNVVTYDADGDGFPDMGDQNTVDTLGQITAAKNEVANVVRTTTGKGFNSDFELTFVSTTTQLVLSDPDGFGNQSFVHLPAGAGPVGLAKDTTLAFANGYLNLYADTAVNANTSQATGGTGMNDGTLIAIMQIVATPNVNPFSLTSLDGSDDATFKLVWQLDGGIGGIIRDKNGNPLTTDTTFGFVDSNFDADPDGDGAINTTPDGIDTLASSLGSCGTANNNNCGTENGSFVLVTEPGTLALVGISLIGLGAFRRRWL